MHYLSPRRWVRDHVHHFGGNTNSITIFGESAGGASVEYQVLSPYSKGNVLLNTSCFCFQSFIRSVKLAVHRTVPPRHCPVWVDQVPLGAYEEHRRIHAHSGRRRQLPDDQFQRIAQVPEEQGRERVPGF